MKLKAITTRRQFLGNCGIATLGVTVPHFLVQTTQSIAAEAGWEAGSGAALPGFKDDHILVVVQMSGGNDGLNTIVPHSDDQYYKVRDRIALQNGRRIFVDDHTSFHSALSGMKGLYDQGKVAVIEGVGYPNPDRSHFRSMEIWHTAVDSDKVAKDGWVGRYFDNCCTGKPEPTSGVYVGSELPQAFHGGSGVGVSFASPEDFGYVAGKKGDDMRNFRAINSKQMEAPNETLDFLRHMTDGANVSTSRIQEIARKAKNKTDYSQRDEFSNSMATIARMISGGLGSRIYYTALGGFDTHSNQEMSHERLLSRLSQGVTAFYNDLKAMGESRRVLVMCFSEFGRRVEENASGGTDHGTAGPMFLIGDPVKPGLLGKRPSLTDLDQGDLKFTTDFRSVYASVLSQWFGAEPELALGKKFDTLPILQSVS